MELCEILYSKKYTSWGELEKAIEALDLTVDKGNAFEQFCFFFLNYNKNFYYLCSQIQYFHYKKFHNHLEYLLQVKLMKYSYLYYVCY